MDKQTILISVVIPAYNAAAWLPQQLKALAAQTTPPPFEVIIADNGSTDGTRQVAESYVATFPVRVVDAGQARGAAHARNVGARAARGAILAFCDADDLVDEMWLELLTHPLRSVGGILTAGALHHERFNDPLVLQAYRIGPDPVEPTSGVCEPEGFAGYLATAAGGNFAIRRQDYLQLKGMDSSYPGGAEETDFAWRAQEAGMAVLSVPAAVVHYRLKSDGRSLFRQQRIQQSARMLLWMRYGGKMRGPSWTHSLLTICTQAPRLPKALVSRHVRLDVARILGGHTGAVQGMIRYRLLRRVPKPSLMSPDAPSTVSESADG